LAEFGGKGERISKDGWAGGGDAETPKCGMRIAECGKIDEEIRM
jgi:hypothetical protein